MTLPHIMTAGFDDLIPVVIILTVIITRIMKAAKQGKPLVPPPPSDRPRTPLEPNATQPAEELREFLQALSGVPQQKPEPPPVQAQQRVTQARPQPPPPPPPRVAKKARFVRTAKPAPSPAPSPVPPKPKQPAPFWNQPPPAPRPVIVEACELNPARKELNKHLEDARSLRGAWILREVLGPPVALRR